MNVRIYYEDTDAAGVVYHARYLHFMERARAEFFRKQGYSVATLANEGYVFPVVDVNISFKQAATLDEELCVTVEPAELGGARFSVVQKVLRVSDGQLLVEALVTLACIGNDRRPRRIPAVIATLWGETTA